MTTPPVPPPSLPPLAESWHSRDLPVLIEVARRLDAGERGLTASELVEPTGFDLEILLSAFTALDGPYIDGKPLDSMGGRIDYFALNLTERGRRAVGLWPSEKGGDALIELLRQAAEQSTDDEERGLLKRAANSLAGVSTSVLTDVVATAAKVGLGLS